MENLNLIKKHNYYTNYIIFLTQLFSVLHRKYVLSNFLNMGILKVSKICVSCVDL
jgi:hypothetical protein